MTTQDPRECKYYTYCDKACLISGLCKHFTSKTELIKE